MLREREESTEYEGEGGDEGSEREEEQRRFLSCLPLLSPDDTPKEGYGSF